MDEQKKSGGWQLPTDSFINRVVVLHGKNSLRRCSIRDFPTSLMLQTLFFTNIKATGVRKKIALRGYFCIQLRATLRLSKFVGTAKALNNSFLHKTNYLMNDKTTNICVIHSRSYLTQSVPYSDVLKEQGKKVSTNNCLPKLSLL